MALQLDGLARHGELAFWRDRYSPAVRAELLAMSAFTRTTSQPTALPDLRKGIRTKAV